ncbi:unnamed protein product [Brassica rapa]|uniref:Jacalin-type lectin domain-containing protein n=2 Tax=Brassica TaxID=3705 RepID=A0A3P5ZZ95_BRACM|nr:unnamed protein product [Brassica napus]CAG7890033.1 unnamed protein product [Brassica rapa]CDY34978.1 BnaA01g27560D [Brassica napus]VDC77298.1 unnamed protein product [Brassica rapa]
MMASSEVLRRVLVGDDGINVSFLKMVYDYTNGELVEVTHGVDFGNAEEGRASRAIVSHDQVVSPEYPVPIKSNGDEASTIVGLRGRSNQHELTELKANFGPPPPITTKRIHHSLIIRLVVSNYFAK